MPSTKAQLMRDFRHHVMTQLYDESAAPTSEVAIYGLSDPRELREARYIGQTSDPKRRLLQHLSTARLWLPDDLPWWIKSPKLRPLYEWIRQLYGDERRLPTMIVFEWTHSGADARAAERAQICAGLARRLPLLNFEAKLMRGQWQLL